MKQEELKFLGFKRKGDKNGFWYEVNFKNHRFITNDDSNYKYEKKWYVGYENKKSEEEIYWFQTNIDSMRKFVKLFEGITDYFYSMNGVHKKIK